MASGATVKPSLVFLKKFTEEEAQEYEKINLQVTTDISKEFYEKIKLKNTELKNTKDKEKKDPLKSEIKDLEIKKEEKIKKNIKEKLNYQIAIAEVSKA